MPGKELQRAQVFTLVDEITYSPDAIVSRTLTNRQSGTVTLFAFDAGQELSEHTAPYDAQVHILEGKVSILIAGEEYFLETGQIIIMPANIPHALQAKTQVKLLLTMIKTKLQH